METLNERLFAISVILLTS